MSNTAVFMQNHDGTNDDTSDDTKRYQHELAIDVEEIELFQSVSPVEPLSGTIPDDTKSFSIQEAAKLLGVSKNTIRSRLKSGELSGCIVKGKRTKEWRVYLTNDTSDDTKHTSDDTKPSAEKVNPDLAHLLEIIEKQAARLEKQNARLEAASGQIGYLQAQLENSREEVKLLEDRSKRPWWRRLWESLRV